jgi:hypothetical protein
MKIHNRLALLLLTAGLAACGNSDPGVAKGDPLTSTGVVVTSNPVTAPTAANKASVGFRVSFPKQAGVSKAALNPAMTTVTITTSGECGVASLELTPTTNSGVMSLAPGTCNFEANAYDSSQAIIDTTRTNGTLLTGPNDISLTFLGGPWLFVDPVTNEKVSLALVGGEVLTGIRLISSQISTPNLNTRLITRWLGPDTLGDGPTADDILGGTLANPPALFAIGLFSGGTGPGTNVVKLRSDKVNLDTWESDLAIGKRHIEILGGNPSISYTKTFDPPTYQDYYTSKVIDGVTLEGNIAEYTVDAHTLGTPTGTCTVATATPARAAALTAAFSTVRKAAATSIGPVTINWTECVAGQNVAVTDIYSNVNVHPFRARSYFADPVGELQIKFNTGMNAYKQALANEDLVKGTNMPLLRQATDNLVAAADLAYTTQDLSASADAARFFGAISRLASLGVDTASDGVENGLNNFGDLLDAIGVPVGSATRDWSKLIQPPQTCVNYTSPFPYTDCTPNLPVNGTRSGPILTLLDSKLNTQLDLAIADLGDIPAGFSYNLTDPSGETTNFTNFDYGDVLALTAVAHGVKAELAIDMAYDLNLDIAATFNGTGPASVQAFLDANPTIGTIDASRYVSELAQARTDLQSALTTMQAAINVIEAEGTGVAQESEFVSFYHTDYQCIPNQTGIPPYCTWTAIDNTVQNIADFRDGISKALAGLDGPVTVDDNGTPTISDDSIIDPSKFFAGISFRSLLPGFTGDNANSLFPDPTMGGVLVQTPHMNINQDLDGNGVPDQMEKPHFYPVLLSGKVYSLSGPLYQKGRSVNWSSFQFGAGTVSGTVSVDWNYINPFPPYGTVSGTATGTWSILPTGQLQILFTSSAPLNLASMVAELNDPVNAQASPINFATNLTLTYTDNSTEQHYTRWNQSGSIVIIIQ